MQASSVDLLELLDGKAQFVIPIWQRRYCWTELDINRLIHDLLLVARDNDNRATHYTGTILRFPENVPPGHLRRYRIVDGQQRLTTMSILLGCIAQKLGPTGQCGNLNGEVIRNTWLLNQVVNTNEAVKLQLQEEDADEYKRGLEGEPFGKGAITQAWNTIKKIVEHEDTESLINGIHRLRVVGINLSTHDDPQQIFESINSTGRLLTESEKVKNWLLINLREDIQEDLFRNHWKKIESELGAVHSTEPMDIFFRDLMRWKVGRNFRDNDTFQEFRRWAQHQKLGVDRPALCRELSRLALLYRNLIDPSSVHLIEARTKDRKRIEKVLRHLKALGMDVHRPLTLRMLNDAFDGKGLRVPLDQLATALHYTATWLTRNWLAGNTTQGLNTPMTELAFAPGPSSGDDYAKFWQNQISRYRNRTSGVPSAQSIRQGIHTRKAYGGSSSRASLAILCELMEHDQDGVAPARTNLTLEHIMPQKLNDDWRQIIGENAEEVHRENKNLLGNLTLTGDVQNARLGADSFQLKKREYRKSSITMTREIANEQNWNAGAISRRADNLCDRVLGYWYWEDEGTSTQIVKNFDPAFSWQIDGSNPQTANSGTELVVLVVKTLLDIDQTNANKLTGRRNYKDLLNASDFPSGRLSGARLASIPNHEEWVIYPYSSHYPEAMERCHDLASRCNVEIRIELSARYRQIEQFWVEVQRASKSLTGIEKTWISEAVWDKYYDIHNCRIYLLTGNPQTLEINCTHTAQRSSRQIESRMHQISLAMWQNMNDQQVSDINSRKNLGKSISIYRDWDRDNEKTWPDVCRWIVDQCKRLEVILAEVDSMTPGELEDSPGQLASS